jgi:hypothetical protein
MDQVQTDSSTRHMSVSGPSPMICVNSGLATSRTKTAQSQFIAELRTAKKAATSLFRVQSINLVGNP